jgi:hypothetical protein
MVTPINGQGHRCSICNTLIQGNGKCDRCAEKAGGFDRGEETNPHSLLIAETLRTIGLSDEEIARLRPWITSEFERRLPQILKSIAIATALPSVERRVQRYYASKNVGAAEAEDLGSQFVLKVLRTLFGLEVRGNSGAWLMKIRNTVLLDHWRAKERERKLLGKRKGMGPLADIESVDEQSLRLAIEELPPSKRDAAKALLEDPQWTRTVEYHEKKLASEKQPRQSLELDGDSVLLRNKRNHRATE